MTENKVLNPLQRFYRLLLVDQKDITQVYIYALFTGLVNLSLPLGLQAIINLIQGGEISTAWVVLVILVIFGILFTGILQLIQLRIVENVAQKIFSRASFEFAFRIPRIKAKQLYYYYAPELANRFFDTLTIQKGLPKILIDFSLASFQVVVGLVVLSLYHPFFILFGIALIALIYVIFVFTGPKGLSTSLVESKYKYQMAHWLEEVARTRVSFKLMDNPQIALNKTDQHVSKYLGAREKHFRILVIQFLQFIGFKVLIAAGLLIIGGVLVFNQEMNIGQFVAAEIIVLLIINSVEKLIRSLDSVYDVLTALEKIGYVTDMKLDDDTGLAFNADNDDIELGVYDLSYLYPDNTSNVLEDITFTVPKGKSALIMGSSGSGKSTLMQLLSGIIEPDSGVIKYNGLSLRSINSQEFRSHVGFSLSNNETFLGTLLDNIAMGREKVSISDVSDVIDFVNLREYVKTLPEGLNTIIDPEGKKLPRSVSNKILLARAVVAQPKLLLLEDPLDHVSASEKEIIIKKLTDPSNPWSLVVTTVDDLWRKYISEVITVNNGKVVNTNQK